MADDTEERFCPICEERMFESLCPSDNVQTIPASVLRATTASLSPGAIVNERYEIAEVLGSGAMGTVYSANQMSMDRRVALKVLTRDLLKDGTELRRFYREAKNASRLKHPNVVRVYDFGVDETSQLPFIAMELIEGRTLRRLIAEQAPMSLRRAAALLEQVAKALVAAHQSGIIHRDLKPDNIMVSLLPGDEELATVLDFGIAKSTRAPGGLHESLTASGVVVGTPRYMSPEQVRGQGIDARSDLYALGCIFHEMVTGEAPFTADDPVGLMLKHVNAVRPELHSVADDEPGAEAARVLQRALMAQEPDHRPRSAHVVSRVFRAIARGQPIDDPVAMLSSDGEQGPVLSSSGDHSGPVSSGDSGTLVKPRIAHTPTPVDSRAFSSLGIEPQPSASTIEPAPRRPALSTVLMVLGAVLLVGGAVWAIQMGRGSGDGRADVSAAASVESSGSGKEAVEEAAAEASGGASDGAPAAVPPPVEAPPVEAPPVEAAPSATQSPPPPAAPSHPATVRVRITGSPAGAVIRDRGRVVGKLPSAVIEMPYSSQRRTLQVSASKYISKNVTVVPTRDRDISVKLAYRVTPIFD
jgi:serine/threonine-protein kinase